MPRPRNPAAVGDTDATSDRRFVTALARGLALLRCFRPEDRWLAHQEIARRTQLPQATVSRLAFTLVQLGYLQHRAEDGHYALALPVLSLGYSVLSNFELGRIARPVMQALADHSRAAVSLGQRHGLQMVYVAHCRGGGRLTLGLDVGTRLPLAPTAMGRALLVALPPGERAAMCRRLEAADPAAWPTHRQGLERALRQHAQHGFVTSERDWESDISAVGAALELGDGREPLVLTIGGPSSHLTRQLLLNDLGPRLVEATAEIRARVHAGGVTSAA